jgi:serine/threonine-protein kinase
MPSLSQGSRVGPYEIIAPLRGGGMATLWLARRVGPAGFSRPVAIKVIHDHLAEDHAFVEMFLDEARLAAKIVHPNVVRVEELGQHGRSYFLAMEWVRGAALSSLMAGLAKQQRGLSPAVACAIAMQVADGLHAAHEATDEQGVALDVIHRDVSPQNILLSVSGHVKLIDFGVAKARGRRQQSEAGELRGKLRYMAPEQAWGRPIDRRADIYALGVVLWEMLTRDRLFHGDSEIALLEAVRAPNVTPPHLREPDVSEALSEVVMTALAPRPEERYQSAQALRRAIGNACPEAARIEPDALAALLLSVTQEELEEQSRLLSGVTDADLAIPKSPPDPQAMTQLTRPMREQSQRSAPMRERLTEPMPPPSPAPRGAPPEPSAHTIKSPAIWVASSLSLVLLGMGGAALYKRSTRAPSAPYATQRARGDDAGGARGACANAMSFDLGDAGSNALTLDTRGLAAGRFPFGRLRRADAPPAPDIVVQVRVDGSGPRAVDLSTVNTGTDVRFDTTLGVYRGPCDESMVQRLPDIAFDDDGAAREFRARGSLVARGGDVLTVVLTGFGGAIAGRVDRGLVQLDITSRETHRPTVRAGTALVAGHSVFVTVEGEDVDRDLAGLRVQLLDEGSSPLQRGDAGVATMSTFDHPVDGVREIQERLLVEFAQDVAVSRARFAAIQLTDRPGDDSEPLVIPVVHGAIVGPGERCDTTHVCATELVCNARAQCQATSDRVAACDLAQSVSWTFDAQGVGRARTQGMIQAGTGLFAGMCIREATRGREDIARVTVPAGRWRLVASTDAPLAAGESAMEPDTILYVRERCTDTTEASAPLGACNDDIEPGRNQRSRVEHVVQGPAQLFVFTELWGGSLNDARGEPYSLALELHPLARR